MKRKNFLQLVTASAAAMGLPAATPAPAIPIMLSTWDSGMKVNDAGWEILKNGGAAIDAIEKGGNTIEATIDCCVGLGGYPDRDGIVTLDASIMTGGGACGSVAALEQVANPISVARKLMETTPHVFLAGHGAQQFAVQNGFELMPKTLSASGKKAYDEWLKKSEYKPEINIENKKGNGPFAPPFFEDGSPNHDTMGMLALDSTGHLCGGVTTSGMAFKVHGRVGDSPIIGAGLFVDDEAGAATSSGVGEEVIRICGTHLVVELMRQGMSPERACKKACERIANRDKQKARTLQVGFLAMDKKGRYGAYALQKGFVYSLRTATENKIIASPYLLG